MFGLSTNDAQTDPLGLKPKTFDDYDRQIREGLPSAERERIDDAYRNLRYANGHFDDVMAQRGGKQSLTQTSERWDPIRPTSDSDTRYEKSQHVLTQPVMKRVISKLCENLYKRGPSRELADKRVSAIYAEVCRRNEMGPLWQRADEFTAIGGFAGFQYAGVETERSPVKINLWSADQVTVWTDPEDHRTLKAVATFDKVDGRTRATLWTEDKLATYTTKRTDSAADGQTRKFQRLTLEDNPYRLPETPEESDQGRGIIPFTFPHFCHPTTEFTYDSPGDNLYELNRYVNFGFDDLADGIRYLTKPIGVAEGVDEGWEAPAIVRPGMFLNLSAGQVDAGGNGPQPKLSYLTAPNDFVSVIWSHLNNYLDLALELEGIPPSAVRMILDARSGVSILAEQAPLLGWTQHRRGSFHTYELAAVEMFCRITASHLRTHGFASQATRFDASALDPGFNLRWPRLYVDLPGPERDRSDGVRLQWGQCSLIDLTMERDDVTREQAVETLKRVKTDNEELTALGIVPLPAVLDVAAGQPKPVEGGVGSESFNQQLDKVASSGNSGRSSGTTGEPVDANGKADDMSGENA